MGISSVNLNYFFNLKKLNLKRSAFISISIALNLIYLSIHSFIIDLSSPIYLSSSYPYQGFSTLALLKFVPDNSLLWQTALCFVGCLAAASLVSTY